MTPSTPPPPPAPRPLPWGSLLCLFLLLRSLPWLLGDLWYDEVLSLQLFLLPKESLWEVFRDYRIANNHFLANAIQWLWLRLSPAAAGSEPLLRLPSLLLSLGTLLLVQRQWSRWLGAPLALWTAFLLAASPLFAAFAIYMRGYPLALFLSTLALTLLLFRLERPTFRNGLGLFLCALGLPLVMPSAATAPLALCVAGALLCREGPLPQRLRRACRLLWPLLLGASSGCAYYLTLWEDFQRARVDSGGWSSGWLVALHLLAAFALHLLPALLLLPQARARGGLSRPLALAGGALAAILAALLAAAPGGHAPFPRVFLPLLPLLTLGTVLPLKGSPAFPQSPDPRVTSPGRLLPLAILPGLLLGFLGDKITQWQMAQGAPPPQNLLQQYYRGDQGNSLWAQALAAQAPDDGSPAPPLAINPTDAPSFLLYWNAQSPPGDTPKNRPLVFPSNRPPKHLLPPLESGQELLLLAHNQRELQDYLALLGLPEPIPATAGDTRRNRTLFRLRLP
ncbi:MAG: hypothetical protein ACI4Q0_01705 [Oligosphaeraceae bacterium]